MMKKLGDLLASPPSGGTQFNLDNLAVATFPVGIESVAAQYCASSTISRTRYGIRIDSSLSKQHNSYIKEFELLAENEKHLINKVMFSANPIVMIVGAIGSGKTTFCRLLRERLSESFVPGTTQHPAVVYVDLLKEDEHSFYGADEPVILEAFYSYFSMALSEAVQRFYSLDEEITTVWDRICSRAEPPRGSAFRSLVDELRTRRLENWYESKEYPDYESMLTARSQIRERIRGNKRMYANYLAELLEDSRFNIFSGTRWGVVVLIDNIDQLSLTAQQCLRRTVEPLLRTCDVRSVIMMRQSTFRMTFSDGYSYPVDVVPHIGPMPSAALRTRLQWAARANYSIYGLADDASLRQYVVALEGLFDHASALSEFVDCACGFSVRKAFVIAQHLFTSPFVSLTSIDLDIHRLKRAMICATDGRYSWDTRGIFDNLFSLHSVGPPCYLLKLRILHMLTESTDHRPVLLRNITTKLTAFGYQTGELRIALNEMMADSKRLVWTDSVLVFPDVNSFNAAAGSALFLSKAGRGMLRLSVDLDYVEEVMLDTPVDASDFGGARFDTLVGRMRALYLFLKLLWRTDQNEVIEFADGHKLEDYAAIFPKLNGAYISSSIIDSCCNASVRILASQRVRFSGSEGVAALEEIVTDFESLLNEVNFGKPASRWPARRASQPPLASPNDRAETFNSPRRR